MGPYPKDQRYLPLREIFVHGVVPYLILTLQFTAASFLPLLKKGADNTQGYASQIINVTSISGLMKGSSGGQFAYAASKASMVQVSRAMYY